MRRLEVAPRLRNQRAKFQLVFNLPLDAAVAGKIGSYRVTQPGRFGVSRPMRVAVRAARYDADTHTVTLTLGRILPGRPLRLMIRGVGGAGLSAAPIVIPL